MPAAPLPEGFPRMQAYSVTYPKNLPSMEQTEASLKASDWNDELKIFVQPDDWPIGLNSAFRNSKRMLEAAVADGCDFALFLEDDVRVGRHLRHNLMSIPLVRRDQCDFLSLYIPDLIASPWARREPHLGYRKAKPLYTGPNKGWEKHRLWGSQGLLLSRRFLIAAVERWDQFEQGIDSRMMGVCRVYQLSMWYAEPCLMDHAMFVSAHNSPPASAPDFNPEFRLNIGDGFQPPEAIPGDLTIEECELLWNAALNRNVLELTRVRGQTTVCLGQQAQCVVSIGQDDPAEASEWVHRYGLTSRVEFRQTLSDGKWSLTGDDKFDLILIDGEHDATSLERDIAAALKVLNPQGVLAFHAYPDPSWPKVRKVVDDHARRFGWKRIGQAGYLGLFQT